MTVRTIVIAAVAAVAAAGLVVVPAAAEGAAGGLDWRKCAPEVDAPSGTGCATVEVPRDYGDPSGRKLRLTLAAAGSLDAPNVLVANPGGPGESGIGLPKQIWSSLPPETAGNYLVVSFDPRGVGASSPVDCGDTSGVYPTPLPPNEPADVQQEQRQVGFARTIADACAKHSGDLLPHITTANAARDMDTIRAALGRKKLDYLGYSYGSTLGATYATMFPERAGRMILDSVVDPTKSGYEYGFEQNEALQRRAEQFFDWVGEHADTYHLGTDGDAVGKTWDAVREKLAAKPAESKAGSAELDSMLASSMYSDASWDTVAGAVADYQKGDASAIVHAAGELALAPVNGAQLAYNCVDDAWPRDWRTWHDDTAASARTAPLFAWQNTWYSAPCAFWRTPSTKPVEIGDGDAFSVLLVQAKHDAATPAAGARRMQHALTGSRLVLSGGGNHGQFLFDGNKCVDNAVLAYLDTGTLPAKDVACPAPPPPTVTQAAEDVPAPQRPMLRG